MAKSVSRQKKTRKRRTRERRQQRAQQRHLQAQIDAAFPALVRERFEKALQEEVTAVVGRAKSQRRDPTDVTEVEGWCNRCPTRSRAKFSRGGYYRRSLLTFEAWIEIKVPRISCVWGGDGRFRVGVS